MKFKPALILISLITIQFLVSCSTSSTVDITNVKISTDFPFQDFFQENLNNYKDENLKHDQLTADLLSNPEDFISFFYLLFSTKISGAKISKVYISEDTNKKYWFGCTQIDNSAYRNWIYVIVNKNNCTVVMFSPNK